MFWFLKRNKIPEKPGWILDEKDSRDYKYEELFEAPKPVVWGELDLSKKEPMFPIKSQGSSSSCVGQSVAKAMGILEYYENGKYVEVSARDLYSKRPNKTRGARFRDILDIARKEGATLDYLMPSNGLNEEQMNRRDDATLFTMEVGKILRIKNYLWVDRLFDKFASLMEQRIPIIIGVAGTNEGWRNPKNGIVRPPRKGERIWYHGLVIPPENKNGKNYGLVNGKKAIIGDNSWGYNWNLKGQFVITEDYLPYILWDFVPYNLPDDWMETEPLSIERPKYHFDVDLYYGLRDNEDVKWLQKCLKYLGIFPKNIPETGNFYSITLRGVQQFQLMYKIVKAGKPGFGRVGPKTRRKLNSIFG